MTTPLLSKPFVTIGDVKVFFERKYEFSCTSNEFTLPILSITDQDISFRLQPMFEMTLPSDHFWIQETKLAHFNILKKIESLVLT